MFLPPPEQGVIASLLRQGHMPTIGGGLEDAHHDLQHMPGFCTAAIVVTSAIEGVYVVLHKPVFGQSGTACRIVLFR